MHRYEVHQRFGHLQADAALPCLQLAALYAATSSLLPEPFSQLTGAQTAMQLVRQCWANHPLSPEEAQQLRSVGTFGGHLAPGLRPLIHELELSSEQLSHLHMPSSKYVNSTLATAAHQALMDNNTLYALQRLPCANSRMTLSRSEQERALGICSPAVAPPAWQRMGEYTAISDLPVCPVEQSAVQAAEQRLCSCVISSSGSAAVCPDYPLTVGESPLAVAVHGELRHSWEGYYKLSATTSVVPAVLDTVRGTLVSGGWVLGTPK